TTSPTSATRFPPDGSSRRRASGSAGGSSFTVALLAVAGRPAGEHRRDRVGRGLAGGELVRRARGGVRAAARALVLVEARVLGLVVGHRHEAGGDDVRAQVRADERGGAVGAPGTAQPDGVRLHARRGRELSAEKDDAVRGADVGVRRAGRAAALDVADLAVLQHRGGAAEDVVRVALHVAVAEVLRAVVRVQRVLVADEAAVQELLALAGRAQGDRLRPGAVAVLDGEVRGGEIVGADQHAGAAAGAADRRADVAVAQDRARVAGADQAQVGAAGDGQLLRVRAGLDVDADVRAAAAGDRIHRGLHGCELSAAVLRDGDRLRDAGRTQRGRAAAASARAGRAAGSGRSPAAGGAGRTGGPAAPAGSGRAAGARATASRGPRRAAHARA